MDRNCLSYWFPKLQAAGVPVPRTEIVTTDAPLRHLLDGVPFASIPGWDEFYATLATVVDRINCYPFFLRTGQGSGKHNWWQTCYCRSIEALPSHMLTTVVSTTNATPTDSEYLEFIGQFI